MTRSARLVGKLDPQPFRHIRAEDIASSTPLDRIVALAAKQFGAPIAALSLAGIGRQWLISTWGLGDHRHPADNSPCYDIVLKGQAIVVADREAQRRYSAEAFLSPRVEFFAGVPLLLPDGHAIGCLAVADIAPRPIEGLDLSLLQDLAGIAAAELEMKVVTGTLEPVTRLPNREQFRRDMADLAESPAGMPALAGLIDIVPPQQVDAIMRVLGPAYLDQVVRDVAQEMRDLVDKSYRLYQVSTTQIALLPPQDIAMDVLIAGLRNHLDIINRRQITRSAVTIAMGIVPFFPRNHDATDILRMANSAAQDARQVREYVRVYSSTKDQDHQRRFAIVRNFATALEGSNELFLLYQPQVDLDSGRCYAAEALLRWNHPGLGAISPAEFVPLIDPTMLVHSMTDWVLQTALDQLERMRRDFPDFVISINVSAHNLREQDFVGRLLASLDRRALAADALGVEITEGSFILDDAMVIAALNALAQAGVRIAIDDFGTGYSSLAHLEQLPAQTVKLDQSFMHGMMQNLRKYALVSATISLCQQLGYRVLAEGVETMDVADQLRAAGCHEAQGYGFSRPLSETALMAWVAPRYGLRKPSLLMPAGVATRPSDAARP